MMMEMLTKVSIALLLPMAATASQDSSYYPGWNNPNINADDMYYKESVNVMQGIASGEFSGLYIRYHGCVWSEYGGDNEDENEGCGEENDLQWYSGHTQCFRANVAYSLYGVKTGETSSSGGCDKKHYINSFFTKDGLESFSGLVGIDAAEYGADAGCESEDLGDDDDDDDNVSYYHNQLLFPNYKSYTTGCSEDGEFVSATFGGAFCNGDLFQEQTNSLSNLNTQFDSLGCYQVYAANVADDGDEDGEDGGDNNEDDGDAQEAIELLTVSAACSYSEYPNKCPDPNGKTSARSKKVYRAAKTYQRKIPFHMSILSTFLVASALVMLVLAHNVRQRTMETGRVLGRKIEEQHAVSKAISFVAERTRTYKEMLLSYAEEEEEEKSVAAMQMTFSGIGTKPSGVQNLASVDEAGGAGGGIPLTQTKSAGAASTISENKSLATGAGASDAAVRVSDADIEQPAKSEDAAGMVVEPTKTAGDSGVVGKSASDEDDAVLVSNEEVANAILAEKGLQPVAVKTPSTPMSQAQASPSGAATEPKKKYKRPRLAKIAKFLFGKKNKKTKK